MTAPAKFAPAKGTPPSIEFVEVFRLHVDESYQRTIETRDSRTIIAGIAAAFDWRLCSPLVVSRRLSADATGLAKLFVIDGQHRLAAARLRGDIPFLPCIITTYASAAEEAELFVAVNQRRRRVSPIETFRAALVAGDKDAIEAARLITAAGLRIARNGRPDSWEPGELGQVVTVLRGVRRFGADPVLAALVQLCEAFPDERLEQAGRILEGLFLIHAEPPAGFAPDRMFRALLELDQPGWASAAMVQIAATGEMWPTAMRSAMLRRYVAMPPDEQMAVAA